MKNIFALLALVTATTTATGEIIHLSPGNSIQIADKTITCGGSYGGPVPMVGDYRFVSEREDRREQCTASVLRASVGPEGLSLEIMYGVKGYFSSWKFYCNTMTGTCTRPKGSLTVNGAGSFFFAYDVEGFSACSGEYRFGSL